MDSTAIDRVMQTLPFAQEEPFTEARPQKPLFWFCLLYTSNLLARRAAHDGVIDEDDALILDNLAQDI